MYLGRVNSEQLKYTLDLSFVAVVVVVMA